ncbi:hypothetical protein BaRGS_00031302 [Batillaria attramentaria]|uniref:Uncharacterized protein n=1 Tax=Batillaria attramentaria TaxID=370345 RepID=A0ABD0JSC3_9CAEN
MHYYGSPTSPSPSSVTGLQYEFHVQHTPPTSSMAYTCTNENEIATSIPPPLPFPFTPLHAPSFARCGNSGDATLSENHQSELRMGLNERSAWLTATTLSVHYGTGSVKLVYSDELSGK